MILDILLAEYPCDLAWQQFASAFGSPSGDIQSVAAAVLGAHHTNWLKTAIPALEDLSPNEVLDSLPDGELIVRTVIMRMP